MSTALMTTTLPTIVGMGVVSRTTETMFDRGKRGGRSRKRATPTARGARKFDGKTYEPANWHVSKAIANRDAQYFRKAGHPARVMRAYNSRMRRWGYMVYVR